MFNIKSATFFDPRPLTVRAKPARYGPSTLAFVPFTDTLPSANSFSRSGELGKQHLGFPRIVCARREPWRYARTQIGTLSVEPIQRKSLLKKPSYPARLASLMRK